MSLQKKTHNAYERKSVSLITAGTFSFVLFWLIYRLISEVPDHAKIEKFEKKLYRNEKM